MNHDAALRAPRYWLSIRNLGSIATTIVAFVVVPSVILAQGASPDGVRTSEIKNPGVLVMKNGRVVDGRITQNASGYMVEKENGSMVVPSDLVEFEAANLSEAHVKLQRRVPEQTPATRLNLARWCLTNHLERQAEEEVRAALDLDPNNDDAKRMLERIDTLRRQSANASENESPKPERTADGFRPQAPESLSGLSSDTVGEFTSRIQPILLNKCGNASCHGSSHGGDFQLTHARGGNGSRRRAVEDNLSAALRHIDLDKPRSSALLTTPQENHGRNRRAIFLGARDEAVLRTIEQWVKQVASEKNGASNHNGNVASRSSTSKSGGKRKVDPDVVPAGHESAPFGAAPQKPFPKKFAKAPQSSGEATSSEDVADATEKILKKVSRYTDESSDARSEANPHDAFDPSTFNREKFGDQRAK